MNAHETYHLDVVAAEWCPHCTDAKKQLDTFVHNYRWPLNRKGFTYDWTYLEDKDGGPLPQEQAEHDKIAELFIRMGWDGAYPTFILTKSVSVQQNVDGKVQEDSYPVSRTVLFGLDTRELRRALRIRPLSRFFPSRRTQSLKNS
ncbi:MAG TPA: hypothetical protein VLB73_03670 [Patescibacteria group bacterium]|nr:hypothetical protein [Patescibacteria group bacterium]